MKCNISGCPGEYEEREVLHTVQIARKIRVIEDVPALVCPVCGDTLFSEETVRSLEEMLRGSDKPEGQAPVYHFRKSA